VFRVICNLEGGHGGTDNTGNVGNSFNGNGGNGGRLDFLCRQYPHQGICSLFGGAGGSYNSKNCTFLVGKLCLSPAISRNGNGGNGGTIDECFGYYPCAANGGAGGNGNMLNNNGNSGNGGKGGIARPSQGAPATANGGAGSRSVRDTCVSSVDRALGIEKSLKNQKTKSL
jgi:hypothetical protein